MDSAHIPEIIHLYPTMRCPLNCIYCYVEDVNRDPTELSIDKYQAIIDQAGAMGIKTYDIAGGEPLLYPNIVELLAYIKSKNGFSKLVSNGLYLDRYLNIFQAMGGLISELHISLDAVDETVHDSIRGMNGLFQKATQNIRKYLNMGLGHVKINYVLQKTSVEFLEAMLDFALSIGALGIDIQYLVDASAKTRQGSFSLRIREIIQAIHLICQWVDRRRLERFEVLVVLPGYLFPAVNKHPDLLLKRKGFQLIYSPGLLASNAFTKAIIIKNNGDVTGSTTFINDPDWFIGNVCNEPLQVIWSQGAEIMNRKMTVRSKRLMEEGICAGCPGRRFCRGGDPVIFSGVDREQTCPIKYELKNYLNSFPVSGS